MESNEAERLGLERLDEVITSAKLLKSNWDEGLMARAHYRKRLAAAIRELIPPSGLEKKP